MPDESEIISLIRSHALRATPVRVGIGDDAAVVEQDGEKDLIACCDLMVEGVHFRSEWSSPPLIGRKALAVTLSDIAAMGGSAKYAMVSFAIPRGTTNDLIIGLVDGLFKMAEISGVAIIGGDTSSSPGPLFIDTSAIGECARGRAVTRSGARPGDLIFVTGTLGGSALGLALLERGVLLDEREAYEAADAIFHARREALMKHLAPEPRLRMGYALGESGLATSMIDISDGLSTDLGHILDESRCGAIVRAADIPIANCLFTLAGDEPRLDPLQTAMSSGEEYELLFTVRPEDRERLIELAGSVDVAVSAIGKIVEGSELYLDRNGSIEKIEPSGYEHSI